LYSLFSGCNCLAFLRNFINLVNIIAFPFFNELFICSNPIESTSFFFIIAFYFFILLFVNNTFYFHRIIQHYTVLDDVAFPFIECSQGAADIVFNQFSFIVLDHGCFLVVAVMGEEIEMGRFAVITDKLIERQVARAHPQIHFRDLGPLDAQ